MRRPGTMPVSGLSTCHTGPADRKLDTYFRKAFPSATTSPRTTITIHIENSGGRIFGGIAMTVIASAVAQKAGVVVVNVVGA